MEEEEPATINVLEVVCKAEQHLSYLMSQVQQLFNVIFAFSRTSKPDVTAHLQQTINLYKQHSFHLAKACKDIPLDLIRAPLPAASCSSPPVPPELLEQHRLLVEEVQRKQELLEQLLVLLHDLSLTLGITPNHPIRS